MTVWTIGHGTRGVDELIGVLAAHRIARLVDVRTVPRSRHNPQFNRDRMPGDLERAGIIYVHMPGLGGLRQPRPDSVNTSWRN
ncbi:MAG: DNA repair protein, partial [Candidatus Rokuibacteriota bacterium]